MKYILLSLVLLLVACKHEPASWETAPSTVKCTEAQWTKATQETRDSISIAPDYKASYWLGTALLRNCTIGSTER